jgi:hypothetical protein
MIFEDFCFFCFCMKIVEWIATAMLMRTDPGGGSGLTMKFYVKHLGAPYELVATFTLQLMTISIGFVAF